MRTRVAVLALVVPILLLIALTSNGGLLSMIGLPKNTRDFLSSGRGSPTRRLIGPASLTQRDSTCSARPN